MSFVGSTNQDVGFFSSLNGLVQNLNIESATIIAECTSEVQRNCGILIGTGHATYIRNCTIDETSIINAKNFANTGGICGAASYNTRIENCQNRAKVLSNMPLASAISCASNQNSLVILNCINLGNLSIKTDSYACVIRNSYTLESKSQINDDEPCTIDQLNSKEFYTETLGWSEDIWDFSELDVENGKYPKLKQ